MSGGMTHQDEMSWTKAIVVAAIVLAIVAFAAGGHLIVR